MFFALATALAFAVEAGSTPVAVQITAHNSQIGCDTVAKFEEYNQVTHAKAYTAILPGCVRLEGGTRLFPTGDKQKASLAGNDVPVQKYRVEGRFTASDQKVPLTIWLSPSYTEPILKPHN